MANDCIPYFDSGDEITGHCTSAVTGKTVVKISAADGGNVKIAPAGATDIAFGVAQSDCASGSKVNVFTVRSGKVLPITASGAITAGTEVEIATGGKVATKNTHSAIGLALDDAVDGADAMIKLY
jgi:hypothetical protein